MKLRMLDWKGKGLSFGGRKPGTIVDIPPGVADLWLYCGYCEKVEEELTPVKTEEKLVPQKRKTEKMNKK